MSTAHELSYTPAIAAVSTVSAVSAVSANSKARLRCSFGPSEDGSRGRGYPPKVIWTPNKAQQINLVCSYAVQLLSFLRRSDPSRGITSPSRAILHPSIQATKTRAICGCKLPLCHDSKNRKNTFEVLNVPLISVLYSTFSCGFWQNKLWLSRCIFEYYGGNEYFHPWARDVEVPLENAQNAVMGSRHSERKKPRKQVHKFASFFSDSFSQQQILCDIGKVFLVFEKSLCTLHRGRVLQPTPKTVHRHNIP